MNDVVVFWAVDNEGERDRERERDRDRERDRERDRGREKERERENMHKIEVIGKVCNLNFYYGFKCYQYVHVRKESQISFCSMLLFFCIIV